MTSRHLNEWSAYAEGSFLYFTYSLPSDGICYVSYSTDAFTEHVMCATEQCDTQGTLFKSRLIKHFCNVIQFHVYFYHH